MVVVISVIKVGMLLIWNDAGQQQAYIHLEMITPQQQVLVGLSGGGWGHIVPCWQLCVCVCVCVCVCGGHM